MRDQLFGELSLSGPVARALSDMGYTAPTPIQSKVVPIILNGRDLIGQAQTGTGKTAAFGIPLVEMMERRGVGVQALILVPTRELCVQVAGEIRKISAHRGLRVATLFGGEPIAKQFQALRQGADVVVGTPGRIQDHLSRGTVRFNQVRTVVLDEADRMLDIGFEPEIRKILGHTPSGRQTVLFSATMPAPIRSLVSRYLTSPEWVIVGAESTPVSEVEQIYYEVASDDKVGSVHRLLQTYSDGQTLIFCRTRRRVERLVDALQRRGLQVQAIHGGLSQNQRTAAMEAFRGGKLRLLVATDVAARGIDIPDITHIINFDVPNNLEEYVHRVGRTGRMGRHGTAATFVSEWELEAFDTIRRRLGNKLQHRNLVNLAASA